jgi:zinc protease
MVRNTSMEAPVKPILAVSFFLFVLSFAGADNLSREGFQTATLADGIPVYFKANDNNRVLALQAFFRGGSALMTPETAGYEDLALTLLTRGSAKYSFADLKDLAWRTSSALTSSASSFDGSSFGLVSLPGSFDAVFDAWSDALLHPRWDETEFNRVVQDAKIALQQQMQDPYNRAVLELHHAMFAGHPYAADFSPTADSLAAVTLAKLRTWWESNLRSGRITIVAVGDFDFPSLKAKLDASVGTLPKADAKVPGVTGWTTSGQVRIVPFADAGAVGYVRADFPIPAVSDPDSTALNLGMTVLNDILFDIVRAKYGACYSVWGRDFGFLASYGSLVVYKSDQPGKVKPYIDEAIGLLASGKALASQASASAAGKSGLGAAPEPRKASYVDIDQVLGFYKAKAINAFYEGQQTNGALAGQMASALLYRGDVKAYLDFADRMNKVTSQDVIRVIQKYVQTGPKAWVILAAPKLLQGVTEDTFLK